MGRRAPQAFIRPIDSTRPSKRSGSCWTLIRYTTAAGAAAVIVRNLLAPHRARPELARSPRADAEAGAAAQRARPVGRHAR